MNVSKAALAILISTLGFVVSSRNCYKRLGSGTAQVQLTCLTPGRTSPQVNWFKDSFSLNTNGEKYTLSPTQSGLTVVGIVASDEGNYTCSYTAGSSVMTSSAGCLLVYGKASFTSCMPNSYGTNGCTERVSVSNTGTLTFDLRISYSTPGQAGLLQTLERITIHKSDNIILNIYRTVIDTASRNWTLEGNTTISKLAELHNVTADDRGLYIIRAELTDPATGYLSTITKTIFATAQECSLPPQVSNGYVTNNGLIVSSIAQYTCEVGYIMSGSSNLICIQGSHGTYWNGDIPSCTQETEVANPVMFQLQIGPNSDCTCWSDAKCTQFLETVKAHVSEGISNTCNCSYTTSRIEGARLYCYQHPKYVSVRGFIQGNEDYTAQQILVYLEQWYTKQSTVILTGNRVLNINKSCKLNISDWNEKECSPSPRLESQQCSCNSTSSDKTNVIPGMYTRHD